MNISPVANRLIKAIEDYKEESSKVSYRFTTEEEMRLQKEIEILQNHIELLIKYELFDRDKIMINEKDSTDTK